MTVSHLDYTAAVSSRAAPVAANRNGWSPIGLSSEAMAKSEFLVLEDVLNILRAEVATAGGQSQWARQNGVSRTILNRILSGHRNLQPKVLRALGLKETIVYTRL
jgi:DNA-binding phage protein